MIDIEYNVVIELQMVIFCCKEKEKVKYLC